MLMWLLQGENLAEVIFNKRGTGSALSVCAHLQSLLRGAQTLVCGRCCCGSGEVHSRWISVPQDPLTLQGAEVAIVCVIAIKRRRVINRSSEDGGGRVERGRSSSRRGGGRRRGSQEAAAGGGATLLSGLPQLLMLLLLVRGSNLRQRPQFGFNRRVLNRTGPALGTGRRFTGGDGDQAPRQILALAVEVLHVVEMVMTEDRSLDAGERRRSDGLGRELRAQVVLVVVVVLVALVTGLIRGQLSHTANDLLSIGFCRAGVVCHRVHMQADTWGKKEKTNQLEKKSTLKKKIDKIEQKI